MHFAELTAFIHAELAAHADAPRANAMAAYMKTTTPFYGVVAPIRRAVGKVAAQRFKPTSPAEYTAAVAAVWALPHREERYLAIQLALAWRRFITPAQVPLYQQMIVEGAWWDLVDEIACHLFGHLLARHPAETWPVLDAWIDADDLWLRRTALLAQNRLKVGFDADRLFAWCLKCSKDKDFFIRKAIGWALREHAKKAPEPVAAFLRAAAGELSGLSYREASRHLVAAGLLAG